MPPFQPQAAHFGLILPLCTSSATVGLALYQYPVLLSFISAEPSVAGKPLSRFSEQFFKSGTAVQVAVGLATAVSGVLSARWLKTHQTLETTDVSNWYTYGAILAAGHFVFVPLVASPIKKMVDSAASTNSDDVIEQSNRAEMKTWLTWHTVRTVVTDLPALWCFAEGAALSFWVANA